MSTSSWSRSATTRRLGSVTAVCAASTAAMVGFAGTAAAAVQTQQTMQSEPSSVRSGTQLSFAGKLTGVADQPLAGEKVQLQTRSGPNDSWSVSGTDTTSSEGVAKVPATITESAQWRLHYTGDRVNDPSASRTITVESTKPINERIVDIAAAQAGDPYSYGAEGPNSFDCSGLTQYVHSKVGIDLPRTTSDQRAAVARIPKSEMKPGDLVFFGSGSSPYHVGIYAGGDKIWAAPEPGDVVRKQDIWTDNYSVGRAW